jgi:hypothetical protein
MKRTAKVKKSNKGRPKSPELEIIDLSELKKKIKEIKKRKTGIYHRLGKRFTPLESTGL